MISISQVTALLRELAPPELAEEWDNVGLLLGDEDAEVSAVMTCLTLTPGVAAEAIGRGAQLVVSHHPVLFRPVQRLTTETPEGRMLLDLTRAGIAVFSPHTGYDSAPEGINQQLADLLELSDVTALRPQAAEEESPGAGRCGNLPSEMTLADFNRLVKQRLGVSGVQYVGYERAVIRRVGIACGSAAEFMADAKGQDCQVLLTGEARFHACLEARSADIALVLAGHYATERPALERLAKVLARRFGQLTVWASQTESDPVQWA